MEERFLLYIDILGFSEMTKKEPRKIVRLYSILDKLNAHRHDDFKTIVFSDTILVYNTSSICSKESKEYLVWYLIEFVEDLYVRLVGQDIYFRAFITKGHFQHYELKNIECFYGRALVDAYIIEKTIPSIGLFINNDCQLFNKYFPIERFDQNISFVYLTRSLEQIEKYSGGSYPIAHKIAEDQSPNAPRDILFLEEIYQRMRNHQSPSVRAKYLTAWDYYLKRYPSLINFLVANKFSLQALGGKNAWVQEETTMKKDIRYYKRIGSGSALSIDIGKIH